MTHISFPCGCGALWHPDTRSFVLDTFCSEHGEVDDSMRRGLE